MDNVEVPSPRDVDWLTGVVNLHQRRVRVREFYVVGGDTLSLNLALIAAYGLPTNHHE